MSQAGRDAMAANDRRNRIGAGTGTDAPAAMSAELAAALARQRAKHLALMLMAASTLMVLGGILLLLWLVA